MNEDYIVAFREILQEAERKQQEALARFHRWSAGTMDPAEEEAYTSAEIGCWIDKNCGRLHTLRLE